ncbi:MAG: hypothetical protein Q4C10_15250, partial [Clostridia bacterium]|nr:hypothetical protein [Clostridia bacterium]
HELACSCPSLPYLSDIALELPEISLAMRGQASNLPPVMQQIGLPAPQAMLVSGLLAPQVT